VEPRPKSRTATWADSRWGGPWVGLAALLVGAGILRLVGISYALPYPLLNPDEASIVPRAWRVVHGGGLDPHFFDYPSLLIYVEAPFQRLADEPSYLTARLVLVAIALGGVAAAWWLGRAAYGTVAGFVAGAFTAVDVTHVAYSRTAVTDVPLTTAACVSLALLVSGRLEWAAAAAGLAASFKYPGILLLAPIVAVGWGQWRRVAVSAGIALGTFAVTSPFVLLDAGQAWGDVRRVQRLAHAGWLGFEGDPPAPVAYVERLWDGLGPALILGLAGIVVALVYRRRADVALVTFAAVWFAQLMTTGAHFDRYTLPLVPVLGALAGRLRSLVPVTLLLLVVPFTWAVRDAQDLTRTDTRVVAHDWIEANLPHGATIAVDPSTPRLDGFRRIALELPGPGRPSDPDRDLARLRERGASYVLVTGAVTDRVLDARGDYPREAAFYDALARRKPLYRLEPGGRLAGPWVALYPV
jgi:4-amino-4-deoxy-L-arabinose transferase-like glycosyltransferase